MRASVFVFLAAAAASVAGAQNWPQWRGPSFNGSSPEQGLPVQWSQTSNVAWSATLPGPSAATPVIWGDRVFVASTDPAAGGLAALCLDRKSGKILWQHKSGSSIRRDERSTYSAPSPCADGQRVFFFDSTGQWTAYDFEGRELWSRNIQADYGTFAFLWTFSTSPVLFDGRLYLQVLQRDVSVSGRGRKDGPNESYLLAVDPATGRTLWKVPRTNLAAGESREAFSSPVPLLSKERPELVIAGGDCLTGHDPATGKELWRWGGWNPRRTSDWRLVPSPVCGAGLALACAPKGGAVYAVKTGGAGELDTNALAWSTSKDRVLTSDVPTPLFYDGDFFILSDLRKTLSRVEAATGSVRWSVPTPGTAKYEASPLGAGGRVYLINFKGEAAVVDARDGRVLSVIPMGAPGDDAIRSSIAAARGCLFIRTNTKLFCVGTP